MIRLIILVLAVSLIWMLWWAFGQLAYEKGLAVAIEELRRDGWVVEHSELNTVGFPNRFDTTIAELHLANPKTAMSWTVPFVQILSLAYKPHQVIAVLPKAHEFKTKFETLTITHEDARASVFMKPNTKLALDEARLVIDTLGVSSTRGWQVSLDEARLAAESLSPENDQYRIGAELLAMVAPPDLRRLLDPSGVLSERIENVRLDAELVFDRPLDRTSIETGEPRVTAVDLANLSIRWDDVALRADGKLTIDTDGMPEGAIALHAEEWRKVLEIAIAAGLVKPDAVGSLEGGLELLSGGTNTLETELQFTNGLVWLGLIPLGPAKGLFSQ